MSTCIKELLIEEGLNKRRSVWMGRDGSSSAMGMAMTEEPPPLPMHTHPPC